MIEKPAAEAGPETKNIDFVGKEEKMQETNVEQLKKEILELKEKRDAVILAHYYVD